MNHTRLSKVEYAALAALDAAARSEDIQTQTGTSLFSADWKPLGTGCNGFKQGFKPDPSIFEDRARKSALITHAEQNAIKNSNKTQPIHYLATVLSPCPSCAMVIKDWDIKEVLFLKQYVIPKTGLPDLSYQQIFDFAGVKYRQITREEARNISIFIRDFSSNLLSEIGY